MVINCGVCKQEFNTRPANVKLGKGKYCSQSCYWESKKKQEEVTCLTCEKQFLDWPCQKRKYCSLKCRKIWNKGLSVEVDSRLNYKRPTAFKEGQLSGDKHHNWQGGVTEPRLTTAYKQFIKDIYKRDNYACQLCKMVGKKLNADHIKPWKLYPDLRFEPSNLRTLCVDCHRTTDTYGRRVFNYG